MFPYVLYYLAGIATGAGLLIFHQKTVETAVVKVRKERDAEVRHLREDNYRLRTDLDSFQRSSDCTDAYRRGFQKGRSDPMTQAEQFAKNFEGRNVQFRTKSAS